MTNWCKNNLKVVGDRLSLKVFDMVSQQEHMLLDHPKTTINELLPTLTFLKNKPSIFEFSLNRPFYFSSIVPPLDSVAKIVLDLNQTPSSKLIAEVLNHPDFKTIPDNKMDYFSIYWGTKWEASDIEYRKKSGSQSEYVFNTANSSPDDWLRAASIVFKNLTFINSSVESGNAYLSLLVNYNGIQKELFNEEELNKHTKKDKYNDFTKIYKKIVLKRSEEVAQDIIIPNNNDILYEKLNNYYQLPLDKLLKLSDSINNIISSPIQHQFTVIDILMNHLLSGHSDKEWALNHIKTLSEQNHFNKDVLLFNKSDILTYAINHNLTDLADILIKNPYYQRKLELYGINYLNNINNNENMFYAKTTNFILKNIGNTLTLPPKITAEESEKYISFAILLNDAGASTEEITSLINPNLKEIIQKGDVYQLDQYISIHEKNVLSKISNNNNKSKGRKV